jgi:hypothetical protein
MKRGQHDSEYDRVRKRAGYDKPIYDFPDDQRAAETAQRVNEMFEDFRARIEEANAYERQKSDEQKARAVELSMRANRLCMLNEYRAAGVDPPRIDEHGFPAFSLSLAFLMGWRIEHIGDRNVLVASPAKTQRKREDYGNVDGS